VTWQLRRSLTTWPQKMSKRALNTALLTMRRKVTKGMSTRTKKQTKWE
jgi:hypothetical protein